MSEEAWLLLVMALRNSGPSKVLSPFPCFLQRCHALKRLAEIAPKGRFNDAAKEVDIGVLAVQSDQFECARSCPSKLPPILNGGEERALDALLVGLADMDERVRQQARDGSSTNKGAIFRKLDAVSVGIPRSLSLSLSPLPSACRHVHFDAAFLCAIYMYPMFLLTDREGA